jgi:hypothetical protein
MSPARDRTSVEGSGGVGYMGKIFRLPTSFSLPQIGKTLQV